MTAPVDIWERLSEPAPHHAVVGGHELVRGSRVRLRPSSIRDIMDLALRDRIAVVEGFDQDETGRLFVAVTVDDDPGRDLGDARLPGHRFFFDLHEIEPIPSMSSSPQLPVARVLVAGVGNIFLGDDAFGVEVVRRLADRPLPAGVTVRDFGIRGMDLAYALRDFDTVVLIDAMPRGHPPGTLSVIEVQVDDTIPAAPSTHGMDPVRVLAVARSFGPLPRFLVLGCEPAVIPDPDADEVIGELSDTVRSAIDPAIELLESLIPDLLTTVGNA